MIAVIDTADAAREALEQALVYLAEVDGYQRGDLQDLTNQAIEDIYESGDRG